MNVPDDLRELIRKKQVLVVVGAGVSAFSTDQAAAATWKGLLQTGIKHCVQYGSTRLDSKAAEDLNRMLATNDIDNWLAVATLIERKLKYPDSREWNNWITETVGALKLCSRSLIEAIFSLDAPIITTNYDRLLSDKRLTQYRHPISWDQTNFDSLFFLQPDDYVLHLHGSSINPSGVILGVRSYSKILRDDKVQAFLRGLLGRYGLLFIGFGSGFKDPNFEPLFDFVRKYGGVHRNYILLRDKEVHTFDQIDNVHAIGYGNDYGELPRFVRALPFGHERLVFSSGYTSSEFYQQNDCFRDVSISPEMTFVAKGQFTDGDGLVVKVNRDFAISKSPITVREWEIFCSEHSKTYRKLIGNQDDPLYPAVGITFGDANAYVNWLTEITGHKYRIPSEREWEYVARAGTETAFWWGNKPDPKFANYRESKLFSTTKTNTYPANPFGVVDILGNIWEWCDDEFHPDRKSNDESPYRTDKNDRLGRAQERILKGGCFYYGDDYLSPDARIHLEFSSVFNSVGLRVVREIPKPFQENQEYFIVSRVAPICLTCETTSSGPELCVADFNMTDSNKWKISRIDATREFVIQHSATEYYLNGSKNLDDYSYPEMTKRKTRARAKWSLLKSAGGYLISPISSSKALDLEGGRTESLQEVILFERHGNFNQVWSFISATFDD